MDLGHPLSILGIFAQQLAPRLNEVNGNFDPDSYVPKRVPGGIGGPTPFLRMVECWSFRP